MNLATELRLIADQQHHQTYRETDALYWNNIRCQSHALFEEACRLCRKAAVSGLTTLPFGEEADKNVLVRTAELLQEEGFETQLQYHEGHWSAYLAEDRSCYYWLQISW